MLSARARISKFYISPVASKQLFPQGTKEGRKGDGGVCWEKCCITLQERRVLSPNTKGTGTHNIQLYPKLLHVVEV